MTKSSDDAINPKDLYGLQKPGVSAIPPVAILWLGMAMEEGRRKYGHMNWRTKAVRADVYYDAAMRHLMRWWDGEDDDAESGLPHLAHVMACCAILLDAEPGKRLLDNRPEVSGFTSDLIEALTKKEK